MRKVYVDVDAHYSADGVITPLNIYWEDGRVFEVDRVLDQCRAASLKVGGMGQRYTCRICGKKAYLYFDECDCRWFVEAKK